jgi:hypothetical protein
MYRNNGAISLSRTVKSEGKRKKFIKFCRKIRFYRIGMFFVLIGFIYHSIDTTISYLKYETLFDLKSEVLPQEPPSVTFCIDSLNMKRLYRRNISIEKLLYREFECKIKRSPELEWQKCGENFEIIESITPYANRCITFLSQLNSAKFSVSTHYCIVSNISFNENGFYRSSNKNSAPFLQ